MEFPTGAIVPIAPDQGTRLDFSSRPETHQGADRLEVIGNMAMRWSGEIDSIENNPNDRYISFAAGQGLQLQSLIAMEDDWVFTQEGLEDGGPRMYKPRSTKRELVNFIDKSTQAQGAATINVAIHQDGVLGEDVHEVLAGVAEELR